MIDTELYRKCTEELGKRVKKLRSDKGFTLHQMVANFGFHASQWSKVERGGNITVETLFNVANALGVTPGDLLAGLPSIVDGTRSRKKPSRKNEQ